LEAALATHLPVADASCDPSGGIVRAGRPPLWCQATVEHPSGRGRPETGADAGTACTGGDEDPDVADLGRPDQVAGSAEHVLTAPDDEDLFHLLDGALLDVIGR
jgi:hypothetical protein